MRGNSQDGVTTKMPTERIWECKVGGLVDELPPGADLPMRRAIEDAFHTLTGTYPKFLFSGWNAELTDGERFVVEEDSDGN